MINNVLSLVLTIIIEYVVVWFFVRKNPLRIFLYVVLINSVTQPLANYFYQNAFNNFWLIELMVVLAESVLIMWLLEIKYKKAIIISLSANFVTALVSLIFFHLIFFQIVL